MASNGTHSGNWRSIFRACSYSTFLARPLACATVATACFNLVPPRTSARTSATAGRQVGRGGLRSGHYEGDLAAHLAGRGPRGQFGERPAPDLFMGLGQLPADRSTTIAAEALDHGGQGRRRSVRCLEEHHRPRFGGQLGQPSCAFAALAGQEPLEAEPVDR